MSNPLVLDRERLARELDRLARRFDPSCALTVFENGGSAYRAAFGWADRESKRPLRLADSFALDGADGLMLGLSATMLCADGRLSPDDRLGRYIPVSECPCADRVTVMQLMQRRSGLPDPLRDRLLPAMHRTQAHLLLDPDEQLRRETAALLESRSYSHIRPLLNDLSPDGGARFAPSSADAALLAELAERVTGGLSQFQRERIFKPLDITASDGLCATTSGHTALAESRMVRLKPSIGAAGSYTVSYDGLERLAAALAERRLLSPEGWALIEAIAKGGGLPFGVSGAFLRGVSQIGGWRVDIALGAQRGLAVLIAANEPHLPRRAPFSDAFARLADVHGNPMHPTGQFSASQYADATPTHYPRVPQYSDGTYRRFDHEALACLTAQLCYPSHTRMERLSARNIAGALALEPHPEQCDYAASPAMAIADAAVNEMQQAFVCTEGGTSVGLLSFTLPPDGRALLDTLLVDRRYQRRGFGRIMVEWAVRHLRAKGAPGLTVCVDRRNSPARALYESVGFSLASVYENAFILDMNLQ